jgi:hypothetical protein
MSCRTIIGLYLVNATWIARIFRKTPQIALPRNRNLTPGPPWRWPHQRGSRLANLGNIETVRKTLPCRRHPTNATLSRY